MTPKDRMRFRHVAQRKPIEGKQVLVFRSPRVGFIAAHRIGDMWNDGTGNVAHINAWPWWMSLTPVRRAFRSAVYEATKA